MKKIKLEQVISLRKQGLTYSEIGRIYNVNKSIPCKMVNGNIPEMNIGNKSPISERDITKIWEYVPADQFIRIVEKLTFPIHSEHEKIQDLLYRFFYSRSEQWIKKIEKIKEIDKRLAFLYVCGRTEIKHYYSHQQKEVQFNLYKYDKKKNKE